jgi:endonuclease-3
MSIKELFGFLRKEYPDAKYYLNFSNPLELMVAAILSAQCRDEVVNATTKKLFAKYKKPEDYANVRLSEIETQIKSITFYKNKASNIKSACEIIIKDYQGKVPDSMEELVKLPGIGRKTANAILINAFGKVEGIPVDTHVIRVSFRLGLTKFKNPELIEKDLMKLPKENWIELPHLMKAHGRAVCTSIPKCSKCAVSYLCPKHGVTKRT